jgi:hypothetical protein
VPVLNAVAQTGRVLAAAFACLLAAPACLAGGPAVDVSTAAGLREALASVASGTTVRLAPGEYELAGPLVVPDHVVVEGSGQMALDSDGRAAGLQDERASTLRVRGAWSGDAIRLGHGAALRRLRVVDETGAEGNPVDRGEARNLVVVASRGPGDRVEASLVECELSTQQPFGIGGEVGPLGRAVGVWTRNRAGDGPPDADASAGLTVERSVIRAPRSNALFAINFAPRGQVEVVLQDSRLEGVLSAAGGASLSNAVTRARTTVRSSRTDYVVGGFTRFGWQLVGGSGRPHPGATTSPGTHDSELRVTSDGDRILGFNTGIFAAAGRRVGNLSQPSSGNRVDLDLRGLTIRTEGEWAADLRWYGALSVPPLEGGERLPPGENNVLVARITGSRGSGSRANDFADLEGPVDPDREPAAGNRLVVEGAPEAFLRDNRDLSPGPGEWFFTAVPDPR